MKRTLNSISINSPVINIGHPFSLTGVGEALRASTRALMAAAVPVSVYDIFRYSSRDDDAINLIFEPLETTVISPGSIRIFHINGDEVDKVINSLQEKGHSLDDGYNIIVPAWELPIYPIKWVPKLQKFDEIWAISHFVKDALATSGLDSIYIGEPGEIPMEYFAPRRYFNIPESSVVLMTFADTTSYLSRKNPQAAIELFKSLGDHRLLMDIALIIKIKSGDAPAKFASELDISDSDNIRIINKAMTRYEVCSLINCCDFFISLHRSEGFGRGGAEAMSLGKIVLATHWSGNVDYMNSENSLPVSYQLVPVPQNDYPCWEGQHWANPDIRHARHQLLNTIERTEVADKIRLRARADVLQSFSYKAIGIRQSRRIINIMEGFLKK